MINEWKIINKKGLKREMKLNEVEVCKGRKQQNNCKIEIIGLKVLE